VRAGSGLAWWENRLAVVQDDANFVALVDVETGHSEAIALPAGRGNRRQFDDGIGNKADKYDFETIVEVSVVRDILLLLGSGSTPERESAAIIEPMHDGSFDVRVVPIPRFYAALRDLSQFAGTQLNVEGALQSGSTLRLFGRGNGARVSGREGIDATCDIDIARLVAHITSPETVPPPVPFDATQYELGSIGGHRLSFTDATLVPAARARPHRIAYTATAESSPDAVRDGLVSGSALGIIDYESGEPNARWTEIVEENGDALVGKAEGIAFNIGDDSVAWIVLDNDRYDQPSELCEVEVSGL
jgi:hypothetical protein